MNKSETITEIVKALVSFNSEVSKISKDAKNPFFKNNYATLDNIIDEIRPILTKNGLMLMQVPSSDDENISIKTVLYHVSGEWFESDVLHMKPVKNDPQSLGSAITYSRRYSLNSFLSLNTGEDDDGNKASRSGKINPKQLGEIKVAWLSKGLKENQINAQTQKLYKADLSDLTDEQATEFLAKLKENAE